MKTINEGLITPVVRRKQYLNDITTATAIINAPANEIYNMKPSPPYRKSNKESAMNFNINVDSKNDTAAVVEHEFTKKYVFLKLVV